MSKKTVLTRYYLLCKTCPSCTVGKLTLSLEDLKRYVERHSISLLEAKVGVAVVNGKELSLSELSTLTQISLTV